MLAYPPSWAARWRRDAPGYPSRDGVVWEPLSATHGRPICPNDSCSDDLARGVDGGRTGGFARGHRHWVASGTPADEAPHALPQAPGELGPIVRSMSGRPPSAPRATIIGTYGPLLVQYLPSCVLEIVDRNMHGLICLLVLPVLYILFALNYFGVLSLYRFLSPCPCSFTRYPSSFIPRFHSCCCTCLHIALPSS